MDDRMQDRIRLAEAMGWEWKETPDLHNFPNWRGGQWTSPGGETDPSVCGPLVAPAFNPFLDANDDYAVLEWMRNHGDTYPFFSELCETGSRLKFDYKIGDNARAALKVIESG